MVKEGFKENSLEALGLFLYLSFAFLISFLVLFAFGGVEDLNILNKTYLYYPMALIFVTTMIIIQALNSRGILKKGSVWKSYIHDPLEKGWTALTKLSWIKNPYKLSALSFGFFGLLIIISGATGRFLTSFPTLQVSKVAKIVYAVEPANLGENTGIVFLLGIVYGIAKKYSKNKFEFVMYMLLGIIAVSLVFLAWHFAVYGSEQTKLLAVLTFAVTALTLTALTGSIIPITFYHGLSNFFQAIHKLFSSDLFLLISITVYVLIAILLFILAYKKTPKPQRKSFFNPFR